ncbi:hypothetical protein MBLNU13_g09130t1 [Cladosporium sp. NU13]
MSIMKLLSFSLGQPNTDTSSQEVYQAFKTLVLYVPTYLVLRGQYSWNAIPVLAFVYATVSLAGRRLSDQHALFCASTADVLLCRILNVFWENWTREGGSELLVVERIFDVSTLISCRQEEAGFSYGADTFESS